MRLIKSSFRQFILVQSQIVPQLVQKSRPYFVTKCHRIPARKIPNVL